MLAMSFRCALRRIWARSVAAAAVSAGRNRRHGGGVRLRDGADAGSDVAQTVLAKAERVLITEASGRHALIELQLGHLEAVARTRIRDEAAHRTLVSVDGVERLQRGDSGHPIERFATRSVDAPLVARLRRGDFHDLFTTTHGVPEAAAAID